MPIELKKKTAAADENAPENQGLILVAEDGTLTLPGETIASFLDTCDFSAVAEADGAADYLVLAEEDEEDAEEDTDEDADASDDDDDVSEEDAGPCEVLLPGIVASRLVDEGDLTDMFGFYLNHIAEGIEESDESMLQERAALACFADYLDEDGIAESSREDVAEMLHQVLSDSMIVAELDEKFLSKGARLKVSRIRRKPKTGAKKRSLKKRRREEGRGAKKSKIARQKKMFMRKRASRIKQLARESTDENVLMFGFGEGINGANFRVAVSDAPDLKFDEETAEVLLAQCGPIDEMKMECTECGKEYDSKDEAELDEKGKVPPQFLSKQKGKKKDDKKSKKDDEGDKDESDLDEKQKKMPDAFKKKMKGKKDDDDKDDKDDKDESDLEEMKKGVCPDCAKKAKDKDDKKKKDESRIVNVGSVFSSPIGRPSINEGASLAASTLGTMGLGRKTITEDEE